MAQPEEQLEHPLLAQSIHDAVPSTDGAGTPPSVRVWTTSDAGAALDAIIDGSGFGRFQWKICVVVGAVVYMPAGWIILPVFVNPQLAQQQPDVFTERR